jgi:hypothetical protein
MQDEDLDELEREAKERMPVYWFNISTKAVLQLIAEIRRLRANEAAARSVGEMKAVIDKLPKTADGVPVTPGMDTYQCSFDRVSKFTGNVGFHNSDILQAFSKYYSTREAAEAAKESV